jgi:hypothetical protein
MVQRCRCIGVQCRGTMARATVWCNGRNRGGDSNKCVAGEEIGGRRPPIGGARPSVTGSWEMAMGQSVCGLGW